MKHIFERNLLERWQQIADRLPELTKLEVGYDYIKILLSYSLKKLEKKDKMEINKILNRYLGEEEGEEIMTSILKHWIDEGKMIGLQEGKMVGLQEGKMVGLQEGIEKGIEKGIKNTALNMLKENIDIEVIAKVTGLTLSEIRELEVTLKIN